MGYANRTTCADHPRGTGKQADLALAIASGECSERVLAWFAKPYAGAVRRLVADLRGTAEQPRPGGGAR